MAVAALKSGAVEAFFTGITDPKALPPPNAGVAAEVDPNAPPPDEPKADGAESALLPNAEVAAGIPPNADAAGAAEPKTEVVAGVVVEELPKALPLPKAGAEGVTEDPNADGAVEADPNTDVDAGAFVAFAGAVPKVPPPPNADGALGDVEPKAEVEGAVPTPNADGWPLGFANDAKLPLLPDPLDAAGVALVPKALGPELAYAPNAPAVAGLMRDELGCEVCPKTEVVGCDVWPNAEVGCDVCPKAEVG